MREGEILFGHRLRRLHAEGGYGEVWEAEYCGRRVALKLLTRVDSPRDLLPAIQAQYRLGAETDGGASHFPRIEHFDLDADPPYIRMEWLEGQDLETVLGAESVLPLPERIRIARQILEALAVMHERGFVHGDLSPANVLLVGTTVKLIDIGFGGPEAEPSIERSGDASGILGAASPSYAAPERGKPGFHRSGPRADVFSFGKILFRLLTGRSPATMVPPSKLVPGLGTVWDDFVFRCVEEDPDRRFADGREALEAFSRLPVSAGTPETAEVLRCTSCDASIVVPASLSPGEVRCPRCGGLGAAAGHAPTRSKPSHVPDFTGRALLALVLFLAFWVPGAVATAFFYQEAKEARQRTGIEPPGMDLLRSMLVIFVYLPFAVVAGALFILLGVAILD